MRTHLNVAAKLELQTQEKMYESRLHHLENVLEGRRHIFFLSLINCKILNLKYVYSIKLNPNFHIFLEMKQREGHFVHLAEETAVLKDQVDALRELSVMTLKNDNAIVDNGYSHDRRMSDKEAKAHAAAGKVDTLSISLS